MTRAILLALALMGCKDDSTTPAGTQLPTPVTPVPTPPPSATDADGDGFDTTVDCDDGDPTVHPNADERCDGLDQNCDGFADEGLDFGEHFADTDGDGFGDASDAVSTCDGAPAGYVSDDTDCDDTTSERSPGNAEQCDDIDRDCDGAVDNGLVFTVYFADMDGDGFGDVGAPMSTCDGPPAGHVESDTDCDDADAERFPGNTEQCDDIDHDCDGQLDNGLVYTDYFLDSDGDGVGGEDSVARCDGVIPAGRVESTGDCDDEDPERYPGNVEQCDAIDHDCDALADNGLVYTDYHVDADGDGFGDGASDPESACAPVPGRVADGSDCDDTDDTFYPGAPVIGCDFEDRDCDGGTNGIGVPDDVATVAEASAMSGFGDQICVRAGTHVLDNVYIGPGVSVVGEGPGLTILEGTGTARVIELTAASLTGVTVRGGDGSTGAGVYAVGDSELRDAVVENNSCTSGVCSGGGVYLNDVGGSIVIEDVVIRNNTLSPGAQGRGAGLFASAGAVELYNVDVIGNQMGQGSFASEGGGVYISANSVVVDGLRVHGNTVEGPGTVANRMLGAGMFVAGMGTSPVALLQHVDIRGNAAVGVQTLNGVGLYTEDIDLDLINSIVAGNETNATGSVDGVGVHTTNGSIFINHATVTGNQRTSLGGTRGLGIHIDDPVDFTLRNSSVDQNTAASGAGAGIFHNGASVTIHFNNAWGNDGGDYFGPSYTGSSNNISVDPEYLTSPLAGDPSTWDLHLDSTSPLVDIATGGDPDGTPGDVGAYGGNLGVW